MVAGPGAEAHVDGGPVTQFVSMPRAPKEVRTTNETTGGEKGTKIEQYALIPVEPLRQLAEMCGRGAQKYAPRNWERGYEWSKSYSALQRHANAFWSGEDEIPQTPEGVDDDPTAGVHHLIAVAWHALAMVEWKQTHPELDDRPNGLPEKNRISIEEAKVRLRLRLDGRAS